MAKIDDLIIQIKADTKQLQKELKQIEGKIRVTGAAGGAAFGGMAANLKSIRGPALAAAAGIAAIVLPMKAIAGVGSQFEDLKDSLDQVFGSMEAGDQAMQKVFTFAQTTPFQIEDATKAFIALKSAGIEPSMNMLQTFADTASVSIDQLGTFEALIRVVQRSAGGGLGLEELNMIADRGIDVFGGLKEELGLSRDEIAEFGKTAEGAKKITDALVVTLNKKFGGAMESKMDNLSTKTSNMVIAFKQLGDEVFKSGLGDFLKNMADRLTDMANAIGKTVRRLRGDITVADVGITETDPQKQIDILDAQIKADKARADSMAANPPIKDELALSHMTKLLRLQQDITNKETLRLEILGQIEDKVKENLKTDENLSTLLQSDIDFLSQFKKLLGESIPELEKINEQIASVEALRGKLDAKGNLIASDEEIERVLAFLDETRKELGKTGEASDAMAQILEQATDQFANDFINALQSGENALVSFRNLVGDMIQQVIAEFLKMKVIKPLMNALFSAVGLPTIPMDTSAGGGTIQGGRPTLVGERGPEIFVPNTGGTIMNNMNSRNAMGGGTPINIYQNLNFATGVVPTVRAEITKMMPQIADVTKAAVQESAMRGGSYRRSLVGG